METGSVESVHAREDVELLAEQCFEALLAFVAGVNLDASILDHSQLIFQLLGVGRVAVHQLLESADLC